MSRRSLKLACAIASAALSTMASAAVGQARTPGTAAEAGAAFGSRVAADALDNFPIGGPRREAFAYRFRAQWTGTVTAVRFFAILNTEDRTGYSGGTGGTFRVSLVSDSGGARGVPGRKVLARADYRPARDNLFPRLRFPTPAPVQRGRYYNVVFTNPDPNPVENYASINTLFLERPNGARPPSVPPDVSLLWADGAARIIPGTLIK